MTKRFQLNPRMLIIINDLKTYKRFDKTNKNKKLKEIFFIYIKLGGGLGVVVSRRTIKYLL